MVRTLDTLPDFTAAAAPAKAETIYERVEEQLRIAGLEVATGRFAADMNVELCNDGPITILLRVRNGKVVSRPTEN